MDAKDKPAPSCGATKDPLAMRLVARFNAAKSAAMNHFLRWSENAFYACPERLNGILFKFQEGRRLTDHLHDSTAVHAAEVFASGINSSLTPFGERWFSLEPDEEDDEASRDWLADASDKMFAELQKSNFHLEAYNAFMDCAVFGIAAMFVNEGKPDDRSALNFLQVPVGSYVLEESYQGYPNALFKQFDYTVAQLVDEFGLDALPQSVKAIWDAAMRQGSGAEARLTVLQAIYPRTVLADGSPPDKGREVTPERRPFASVYILVSEQCVLREDGYYELPFAAGRLNKANGETMGRGPMDKAMPEVQYANGMRMAIKTAIERLLDPLWLLPDDYPSSPTNRPGGSIYYSASQGPQSVQRLPSQERVDIAEADIQAVREVIQRHFFVDMFELFTSLEARKQQKTAYEVSQMLSEKLARFAPLFTRVTVEFLSPLLERVFFILYRRGVFGPAPNPNSGFNVTFVSKLALAIRATQSMAIQELLAFISQIYQLSPDAAKVLDFVKATRFLARAKGVPESVLRGDDEVQKLIEAEQSAAQQQAALAQLQQGSEAIRNLGPGAQAQAMDALSQQSEEGGFPQ